MQPIKKTALIILLMVIRLSVSGQTIISWNSGMPDHFMIDDLWNLTISKTTPGALECLLELKIETNDHVPVISLSTVPFTIQQGTTNMRMVQSTVKSTIKYGNNFFSSTLQQMGVLPIGNYIFCATLTSSANFSVEGLSCEERQLSGSAPPYLVSPYNEEEITTTYPLLTWHGPTPADDSKLSYSLVLAKINEHQQPMQAIKHNVPMVFQKNIAVPFLNYTSLFTPLEEGKSYAWKADVFYDHQFLGSTEVWSFKVKVPDSTVEPDPTGSYRLVNSASADAFYLADDFLRIGYDNRYNERLLKFQIIAGDSYKRMELDQEVVLQHGINTIDLDLRKGHFKEDTPYLLLIEDANRNQYKVTFYFIKA